MSGNHFWRSHGAHTGGPLYSSCTLPRLQHPPPCNSDGGPGTITLSFDFTQGRWVFRRRWDFCACPSEYHLLIVVQTHSLLPPPFLLQQEFQAMRSTCKDVHDTCRVCTKHP